MLTGLGIHRPEGLGRSPEPLKLINSPAANGPSLLVSRLTLAVASTLRRPSIHLSLPRILRSTFFIDSRIIKPSTMPGAKHRRPGPRLGYCPGYRYLCAEPTVITFSYHGLLDKVLRSKVIFVNNHFAYFPGLPAVHSPEPSLNVLPHGLNRNVPRFLGLQVGEPNGHSQEPRHSLFFYSGN